MRLTRLLQVKLGALAGIKKKKSQTGKNRDRYVHVLRVARVCIGHSEFADATRSVRALERCTVRRMTIGHFVSVSRNQIASVLRLLASPVLLVPASG